MYCPVCFNDTLKLASNGVVRLTFDGKARNTSLFSYNLSKDNDETLYKKLRERVSEYFEWYGGFSNKKPIKLIEIFSSDFICSNRCRLGPDCNKIGVIDILFNKKEIQKILDEEANRLNIKLEFKIDKS
jgi:hypothetical protein